MFPHDGGRAFVSRIRTQRERRRSPISRSIRRSSSIRPTGRPWRCEPHDRANRPSSLSPGRRRCPSLSRDRQARADRLDGLDDRPTDDGGVGSVVDEGLVGRSGHDLVAVVMIHYDEQHLAIQYEGSQNLQHEGEEIHRKYNTWVANLEASIKKAVALL